MNECEPSHTAQGAEKNFFRASAVDFEKIPGSPIAYWVPHSLTEVFDSNPTFGALLEAREGLTTGSNETYVRYAFEVSMGRACISAATRDDASKSGKKWFPYNKGGEFRKWYGNDVFVVNWMNDGHELQNTSHPSDERIWAHNFNLDFIFRSFITWSDITSKGLSVRSFPAGYIFDATGLSAFERGEGQHRFYVMGICNSHVGSYIAKILNPTMHFKSGDFAKVPFVSKEREAVVANVMEALNMATSDWDEMEVSPRFSNLHLLKTEHHRPNLRSCYQDLRREWLSMTRAMHRLEEENNRIVIDAYGLQDELTPDVPLNEITLTCNPHYRYGGDKTDDELEASLLADTMREFLSYAVGCMFGRYSLDKPGLVLANQGETLADYLHQVPEPRFMPDDDNVIPLLDGEWFPDDVTERFRQFLRVTFGSEHYVENLAFIENALGKDVRKYFLKDFYADHVKRYKKRPIYWLFASPKGTFSALIYLHRYRPDTVSVVLQYLRDFRKKLAARLEHLQQVQVSTAASQGEKTKAGKEADTIRKQQLELDDYERDTLYPLATEQVELDLDDGVKVNYLKLGGALKTIPGLAAKGED
jgi:hypothetical protein